jgi:hypothetical protein
MFGPTPIKVILPFTVVLNPAPAPLMNIATEMPEEEATAALTAVNRISPPSVDRIREFDQRAAVLLPPLERMFSIARIEPLVEKGAPIKIKP